MISQTVEYALRAIVTIAQYAGQSCTSQKISSITQVPAPYLSKLMQGLVRAGIVRSQRGLHGGFVLTQSPDELTIWDVVQAVEPLKRIQECPLGIGSHGSQLCPLHRRLDHAIAMVEQIFRETTIAEVLAQPGSVTPLCEDQKVMSISLSDGQPALTNPRDNMKKTATGPPSTKTSTSVKKRKKSSRRPTNK